MSFSKYNFNSKRQYEISLDRKNSQKEYRDRFKIEKLSKHIQPLVEYAEYKDEKEAREKLSKEKSQPQNSLWDSISSTVQSYGWNSKTNIPQAKNALNIIFKAVDDCKEDSKRIEHEPIIVTEALMQLSSVYSVLSSQRWTYSLSHLVFDPPRVLTQLEKIFKDYDLKPDDPGLAELKFKVFKYFY